MRTPDPKAIGRGRRLGSSANRDKNIHHFPTSRQRPRNGLIGLTPNLSAGELIAAAVEQLEREAHLRDLFGAPDQYLTDLAKWLRAGGRHDPVRDWTA